MVYCHPVDVSADCLNDAVAHKVAVDTVALGIIGEQKLHPSCPEEHCASYAEASLLGVSLDEDAPNGYGETHKTHEESRIMKRCRFQKMLHKNHESMTERH